MKKIKWNWGTGIAITLILFIALMASFVYKATQQNFDLVSETYYEDELKFEEIIQQKKNAKSLGERAVLESKGEQIILKLPSALKDKPKSVAVHLYCEQDAKKDQHFSEANNTATEIRMKHPGHKTGRWIAKTTVVCEGITYYFDPKITL